MTEKLNFPWQEVIDKASNDIKLFAKQGVYAEVFQKFTCEHCGARQGMEKANTFYETGTCEECKKVTDIKKNGHNFLILMRST